MVVQQLAVGQTCMHVHALMLLPWATRVCQSLSSVDALVCLELLLVGPYAVFIAQHLSLRLFSASVVIALVACKGLRPQVFFNRPIHAYILLCTRSKLNCCLTVVQFNRCSCATGPLWAGYEACAPVHAYCGFRYGLSCADCVAGVSASVMLHCTTLSCLHHPSNSCFVLTTTFSHEEQASGLGPRALLLLGPLAYCPGANTWAFASVHGCFGLACSENGS